jgi:YVTN family beta-propeller protein
VIDGVSRSLIGDPIRVGSSPWGAAVNGSTDRLYVANSGDGSVSVVDVATATEIDVITVGSEPRGITVNATTNRIYVANYADNTISVIEGATLNVAATIPVGSRPTDIAVDESSNRLYVSHESDDVWVINGATNGVIETIGPLGGLPTAIELNAITNTLFVPNGDSPGGVWRLDALAGSVIGSVSVTGVPLAAGVDNAIDLVLVPTNSAIQFINGSNGSVVYSLAVGTQSRGVAVNPDTREVYVSDESGHVVVVVQY